MGLLSVFTFIGGLSLFLYGMNVLGSGLQKSAGSKLERILEKLTKTRFMGLLLGFIVTAVIQSSSATTVIVIGFVNSGLMRLAQATSIILGANIGTTVTGWILALQGVQGDAWFLQLLKPENFSPIIAAVGVAILMFSKKSRRRDTATIMVGFAVLMFGMASMSDSVAGLKEDPAFQQALLMFQTPLLGMLIGAAMTAIVQSSSAAVGILQAFSTAGNITLAAAIPIILGQNIGASVPPLLSAVGTNKNARRAALIYLYFNVINSVILLMAYIVITAIWNIPLFLVPVGPIEIAIANTVIKVIGAGIFLPFSGMLEKLVCITIPDKNGKEDRIQRLDERFLNTPSLAVEQSKRLTDEMAFLSNLNLASAISLLTDYKQKEADLINDNENKIDHYEDSLGTYLVQLSSRSMTMSDSHEVSKLLHCIGDIERISDHAVNIMQTAQEINEKDITFSPEAQRELEVMSAAVLEITSIAAEAFRRDDVVLASKVEPLEQVVDLLKAQLKARHIERLQSGECTTLTGFVFSDLITNYERVADQCSNIAVCIIQISKDNFDTHEYLNTLKNSSGNAFTELYEQYKEKYRLDA